jgi:hypothetical protein
VLEKAKKEDAEAAKAKLEEAGATVELKLILAKRQPSISPGSFGPGDNFFDNLY